MKILIVGAGPTGQTAALEFARKGIVPEIVDAKKSPSELSRASGILSESVKKLKASGAGDGILEEGVRLKKIKIHYNKKLLVNLDISKIIDPEDLLIALPQARTEAIMSEALKKMGVVVKYDRKVVDIRTNQKEASVTFSNGDSKKYDWVIGSDGVKSTVREKLGIEYVGHDLSEVWSIAEFDLNEKTNPETINYWLMEGAENDLVFMVPFGSKRIRLVSSTPDSIESLPIKLDIKNIAREGTFKISIRQADTYLKGRVLLAGDAAHTHSPVGGRGMNLGIDDAVAAVKSILEGKTSDYDRERRKIGAKIISDTERMRKILVSRNPLVKIFFRFMLFLVQHLRPFQKAFIQNVSHL